MSSFMALIVQTLKGKRDNLSTSLVTIFSIKNTMFKAKQMIIWEKIFSIA